MSTESARPGLFEQELINQRLLAPDQLDRARRTAARRGLSVMEAVVELGFIDPEDILRVSGGPVGTQRPRVAPGSATAGFRDGDGRPYWVVRNPGNDRYLMLNEQQKFVWDRLDGAHSLTAVNIEFTNRFRCIGARTINQLVRTLEDAGFLEGVPPRPVPQRLLPLWRRAVSAILWRKFPLQDVDRLAERLYRHLGPLLWHPAMRVGLTVLAVSGIPLFCRHLFSRNQTLYPAGNLGMFSLLTVAAYLACLLLHEVGHALTCKRYGLAIRDGGFALYLGLPCFYVSTSSCWLAPLAVRIAVSASGSVVNLVLAAAAAILAFMPGVTGQFFLLMAALNYLTILVNLNPLGRFDGYYIAMDLIGVPRLRTEAWRTAGRALAALVTGRWGLMPRTSRLTLGYLITGILYTAGLAVLFICLNRH